jgi:predicted nucleic acid-binding protein
MNALFGDAVYFIALANPGDQYHDRAKGFEIAGRSLVTTHYVLAEVANALAHRTLRQQFVKLLTYLERWADVLILPGRDELYRDSIDLYRQRPDKDWSLTDCISFVVMQREQITEALATDHHFEQAGFVALLK